MTDRKDAASGGEQLRYGDRVEIHVSRWRQALRLIAAAGASTLSWRALLELQSRPDWRGYVLASLGIVTVWIGIRAIREIVTPGPRMVISAEGFYDRSLGVTLPWNELRARRIDFPVLPQVLVVYILDDASWLPQLRPWKRVTYRLRALVGGLGLVIGISGLGMSPYQIEWLIQDRIGGRSRELAQQKSAELRQAREAWLALPWYERQWKKWGVFRGPSIGRLGVALFCGALFALWGIGTLLPPHSKLVRHEGRLVRWSKDHGKIVLELETTKDILTLVSRLQDYEALRRMDSAHYNDHVIAFGRVEKRELRLYGLALNGRVIIDAEQTTSIVQREERKELVGWLGMLAAIVGFIEFVWHWELRNSFSSELSNRVERHQIRTTLLLQKRRRGHSRSERM